MVDIIGLYTLPVVLKQVASWSKSLVGNFISSNPTLDSTMDTFSQWLQNVPALGEEIITKELVNSLINDLSLFGEDVWESLIPLPDDAKKGLFSAMIEGIFNSVLGD